jgi:Flp pilus assembly protein TadG
MRELTRILSHPRDERGVSAVFFGLALTVLVGALGLSVDIGNVAYERTRAQHAADASARKLAYECAKRPLGAACTSLQSTAATYAADSFDGGTVTASKSGTSVTTTVSKAIDTNLLALIGVPNKLVRATATAKVGVMHPTTAYDVLPLGVNYCTWKKQAAWAGGPDEASHRITLRTDALQGVIKLLDPITSGLLNIVETKGLTDTLGTQAVEHCADEAGHEILTLTGATWLTGETVVSTIVKGLFNWDASKCELDVDNDLVVFIQGLENSAFMPQGCPQQFGNGKPVDKGKTILLPVFRPHSQLQDRLDFKLRACIGLYSPSQTCAEVPPKIGVEIVGFAAFVVTGWKYPGNPNNVDGTVGCAEIPLKLNLRSLVANTLNVAEVLVNALLGAVVPGDLTATISCNGLQGYFTKQLVKDPRSTYESGGEDFGVTYASLVK